MPQDNIQPNEGQHVQQDQNVAQNAPAPNENGQNDNVANHDEAIRQLAEQFGARQGGVVDGQQGASTNQFENDPQYGQFNEQLQRYIGVDANDLRTIVNSYRQNEGFIQQQRNSYVEQQINTLRQEIGDEGLSAVQNELRRYAQTDPALARSLNTPEGARLVYARLQQQNQAQQAQQSFNVPGFDRSYAPASPQRTGFMFTQSQLNAMSPDEKAQRWGEIQAAYQRGMVDRNS